MWILTAPFDGELGETKFQKTKLLKTNSSYLLGRKDTPLSLNSKKISHEHGEFFVGKFTVADASDPSAIPTLTFVNKKKPFPIQRGEGEGLTAKSDAPVELQDGDVLLIVSGIQIKAQWMRICAFSSAARGKLPVSPESCASLGINFSTDPSPEVTHHLIPTYSATPAIATSLITSCQLTKPEWLQEVVRLGSLPRDCDPSLGVPLEGAFALPSTNKYRPAFSPSLPASQKVFKVWEPNEERLHIFHKYRFLCVGEKAREIPLDVRHMIGRGGGAVEVFDVQSGAAKFHRALTRGRVKEGKNLVLVGDSALLSVAVGKDVWNELAQEANKAGLNFTTSDTLVQVVLDVDTSKLESPAEPLPADMSENGASDNQSLPDKIPNGSSEEVALSAEPQRPTRRLTRRVASQEPSVQPDAPVEPQADVDVPRPRRALTRRVNAAVPDPSAPATSELGTSYREGSVPPPVPLDLTAPTPARPTKLKRRLRNGSVPPESMPSETLGMTFVVEDSIKEPPLKKFKALFEASDPQRMDVDLSVGGGQLAESDVFGGGPDSGNSGTFSQTQTQTQPRATHGSRSGLVARSLGALREEEEEESVLVAAVSQANSMKRRLEEIDEDVEMGSQQQDDGHRADSRPAKRRVVEADRVGADAQVRSGSKPPSAAPKPASRKGAATGKPDQDVEFLKAIATTKRGKKLEDGFDREFNKLKITKPDLNEGEREEEEEYRVLADFGDDSGLRGNFMTILEMEIFKPQNGQANANARQSGASMDPRWLGKPNFKKFKQKRSGSTRPKIDLVANSDDDCGMGAAYWKGGSPVKAKPPKAAPARKPTATAAREDSQGLSDVVESQTPPSLPPPPSRQTRSRAASSKPPSRAGSSAPSSKSTRGRSKKVPEKEMLFLDDDDEEDDDGDGDEDMGGRDVFKGYKAGSLGSLGEDQEEQERDEDQTYESSKPSNTQRRSTRQPSAKAKKAAAASKAPGTRAKAKAIVVHDDSDDDAVFKGFGGGKK